MRPDGIPVKALTAGQIDDIVKAYGESAALAKRAGFQMVMVHGGHGWLVNQFLSPAFNHRTDEYGGSLENRLRFARRVLQSVRDAVGPGFPIEFRMSGAEFFEGGYDIEEGIRIAQGVEDLVDLIHVSAGSYQFGFFRTHLPMFAPPRRQCLAGGQDQKACLQAGGHHRRAERPRTDGGDPRFR